MQSLVLVDFFLITLFRTDSHSLFTAPTRTTQNCLVLSQLVGGVNTIGDKTRQFCLVRVSAVS